MAEILLFEFEDGSKATCDSRLEAGRSLTGDFVMKWVEHYRVYGDPESQAAAYVDSRLNRKTDSLSLPEIKGPTSTSKLPRELFANCHVPIGELRWL